MAPLCPNLVFCVINGNGWKKTKLDQVELNCINPEGTISSWTQACVIKTTAVILDGGLGSVKEQSHQVNTKSQMSQLQNIAMTTGFMLTNIASPM